MQPLDHIGMGSVTVIIIVLSVVSLGLADVRSTIQITSTRMFLEMPSIRVYPFQLQVPAARLSHSPLKGPAQWQVVPVGGGQEEHGCIGSAGYIWCPELNEYI
jgi:hypothetical protein